MCFLFTLLLLFVGQHAARAQTMPVIFSLLTSMIRRSSVKYLVFRTPRRRTSQRIS
jgi:hypothetical protein